MHTLCCLELFRLAGTANATVESPERDDLFMLLDVTEICICFRELKSFEYWLVFART
jgi:hypothetical protein